MFVAAETRSSTALITIILSIGLTAVLNTRSRAGVSDRAEFVACAATTAHRGHGAGAGSRTPVRRAARGDPAATTLLGCTTRRRGTVTTGPAGQAAGASRARQCD